MSFSNGEAALPEKSVTSAMIKKTMQNLNTLSFIFVFSYVSLIVSTVWKNNVRKKEM